MADDNSGFNPITDIPFEEPITEETVVPAVVEAVEEVVPVKEEVKIVEEPKVEEAPKISSEEKKAARAEAREMKRREKRDLKYAKLQAAIDQCPKEYKPVTTSKYFWLAVLFNIPVIGFIMTILVSVFPRNKNIKNYARSILIFYIIAIIVMLIGLIITFFAIPGASKDELFQAISKIISAFKM